MFPARSLLSLLLIAASFGSGVTAAPTSQDSKVTLAFARNINITGSSTIAAADRARASVLQSLGLANTGGQTKRASSFSVTNAVISYTANVGIGSPPTYYTLLIDTGSSNTWLGASKPYVKTSTSKNTGQKVSVTYGSGSFSGTEYIDTVTLSPALVIASQSIGVASTSKGFQGVDGILGIGPTDLTQGTLSGTSTLIPTVTDNLFKQGTISTEVIGIYYAPTTTASNTNGELTFGGTDSSKITGSIAYVPITGTSPASHYWGIDQSVSYGTTPILSSTAGIVDTGTTLILLATNAFNAYVKATGGILDSATGLLKISTAQYNALKPLNFKIGSNTYALTPNGQIWPRSLNTLIGGTSGSIYLVVGDIGKPSGQGLDFINGYTFLERFYSVYDTSYKRVGFATTAQTSATSN